MSNLDYLIPKEIIRNCDLELLNMELVLTSTSANGQWPKARIIVDGKIIDDLVIEETATIKYKTTLDKDKKTINLAIERYGKTNKDTVISATGDILENQELTISKWILNEVDIVHSNLIYALGKQTRFLTPEQRAYFIEHGISTDPSSSLCMGENASWDITLVLPVLYGLCTISSHYEKHMNWLFIFI